MCVADDPGSGKTYTMTGMLADTDQVLPSEPVPALDNGEWHI